MLFAKHLNFHCRNNITAYEDGCINLLTMEQRRLVLDMGLLHDIVNGKVDSPHLLAKIMFRTPKYRT
jgi:hypothetical protein